MITDGRTDRGGVDDILLDYITITMVNKASSDSHVMFTDIDECLTILTKEKAIDFSSILIYRNHYILGELMPAVSLGG